MSNKKPIRNIVINMQEIDSINIDVDREIIIVKVKTFLETTDFPTVGQTSITNVSIVTKEISFSEVPNINGIITTIDNKV